MCGRYASSRQPEDLIEEFGAGGLVGEPLAPDFNVAPTKKAYAVLETPAAGEDSHDTGRVQRELRVVRWGLVPSWAKDRAIGNRMINARMETVAEKPAYRRAFAKRRCLLPADGYYEWYVTEHKNANGKPVKQPFFIRPKDHGILAMAGLYELWKDPADDQWLWTATVITTNAEDSLGRIHDRMPLMVESSGWDAWLDPTRPGSVELLVPAAPGRLEAFPVSAKVSNVRNNGPELLEPVEVL